MYMLGVYIFGVYNTYRMLAMVSICKLRIYGYIYISNQIHSAFTTFRIYMRYTRTRVVYVEGVSKFRTHRACLMFTQSWSQRPSGGQRSLNYYLVEHYFLEPSDGQRMCKSDLG